MQTKKIKISFLGFLTLIICHASHSQVENKFHYYNSMDLLELDEFYMADTTTFKRKLDEGTCDWLIVSGVRKFKTTLDVFDLESTYGKYKNLKKSVKKEKRAELEAQLRELVLATGNFCQKHIGQDINLNELCRKIKEAVPSEGYELSGCL